MKDFYGYVRVSTAKQGEKGVSLQEQRGAIERHAQRNGLKISEWFEERETAAKQTRGPARLPDEKGSEWRCTAKSSFSIVTRPPPIKIIRPRIATSSMRLFFKSHYPHGNYRSDIAACALLRADHSCQEAAC